MADYLSGLQSFTVQNFAVDEMALKTGEKIQATSDSEIAVQRPNHIEARSAARERASASGTTARR